MFSTSQCKSYSLESYRQVKLCHKISFQEKKLQLTDYPTFLIELLKLTCTGSDFFQSELKSAQLLSSCQLFAVLHDSVVRQTNRNGNSNAKFNFFFFLHRELQFRSPWAGSLVHCLSLLGFAKAEKKRR